MNPKTLGPVRTHRIALYAIARCCGLEFIKHTHELMAIVDAEGAHRMVQATTHCTNCGMKLLYRWAAENVETRELHLGPEPAPAQLDLF